MFASYVFSTNYPSKAQEVRKTDDNLTTSIEQNIGSKLLRDLVKKKIITVPIGYLEKMETSEKDIRAAPSESYLHGTSTGQRIPRYITPARPDIKHIQNISELYDTLHKPS